jgi:hypothetical protein
VRNATFSTISIPDKPFPNPLATLSDAGLIGQEIANDHGLWAKDDGPRTND